VAADDELASQAGVEILRRGGNVVDAAVATGFALSVVRPESCGVGGGGFMVIWNAEKHQGIALDFRERAPLKAHRDVFADPENPKSARSEVSRVGALSVAVPGHVAGLCYALEQFGTLDLPSVLEPAIRLAREGVPVGVQTQHSQQMALSRIAAVSDGKTRFRELNAKYLNDGESWKLGERFHSPQLRLLEKIAREGADGFYHGEIAKALVTLVRQRGGLLDQADLDAMQPAVREPLRGQFDRLGIVTMPTPSSGGIALVEILNILEAYEKTHPARRLEKLGHNSPIYLHLLLEAMKHAFADRAEYLGDSDFVEVPTERLISRAYGVALAQRIDLTRTQPQESYGRYCAPSDSGTSHFSIIDRKGNAVACTQTINATFGSLLVEPTFGIVLNDEMDDFAAVPGQPNLFGLIQSEANAVAPGKRPLSSMTPTIVIQDGKAVHVLGASGGPRIITTTLQVLLNLTRFGMTPSEAVGKPRIHHQWSPNIAYVEEPLFSARKSALERFGHGVAVRDVLAVSQVATRTAQGLCGASDFRKHGRSAGW